MNHTQSTSYTPAPAPGIITDPFIEQKVREIMTYVGSSGWMETRVNVKSGVLDLVTLNITFKPRGDK